MGSRFLWTKKKNDEKNRNKTEMQECEKKIIMKECINEINISPMQLHKNQNLFDHKLVTPIQWFVQQQ